MTDAQAYERQKVAVRSACYQTRQLRVGRLNRQQDALREALHDKLWSDRKSDAEIARR